MVSLNSKGQEDDVKTIGTILLILGIGALLAWAGSSHGATWQGIPVFAVCVLFSFGLNALVFVHAWVRQTEHFFDLTGSTTYVLVILLANALTESDSARSILLSLMVGAWALRLGSFLFLRIRAAGGDPRFDNIRPHFLPFLRAWLLQGLWVVVTCGAALAAISSASAGGVDLALWVGSLVWAIGFTIEVTADRQKSAFRAAPGNRGRFITTGLWAYSQHPNYLGEILLWLGVAIAAFPALAGAALLTLVSPVFVYILLTRISGIPLLDYRARKLWGEDAAYQEYVARTPKLFPRPR